MHKNKNSQNSHSFLALAFFRDICLSRHQRIWNQHKILRFFDTHIDIFQEKNFLGRNSTFGNLKMQMRKKLYIFKHFAKSKKLFFCQYLSFSVWFPLSLKHWSPLLYSPHSTPLQPTNVHKITNVPVFYMELILYLMVLRRANPLFGVLDGEAQEISTFLGPNGTCFVAHSHFRAQKSLVQGPPLPMPLVMDLAGLKTITYRAT